MSEECVKKLEFIKQNIIEGTYCILSKNQWDMFAQDLSNCGNKLLKKIEETRSEVRKIKITLFAARRRLEAVTVQFDEVAKEFDLFFDSGTRWLRSVIESDEYTEYQILYKKHVERLVEHSRQAMDYLGSIVSSKRDDYRFCRSLVWSIIAITIALMSLIFSIYAIFKEWLQVLRP